jgi:type II secretory ATPase GspE/PulE/Tfp pilus assembly ATPase PilB-like protein
MQGGIPGKFEEKLLCRWQHHDEIKSLYRGKGCEKCGGTGYKGRIGIFELIVFNDEIRELILTRPSANMVGNLAKVRPMKEDGLLKVRQGQTTIDEVVRVTIED